MGEHAEGMNACACTCVLCTNNVLKAPTPCTMYLPFFYDMI